MTGKALRNAVAETKGLRLLSQLIHPRNSFSLFVFVVTFFIMYPILLVVKRARYGMIISLHVILLKSSSDSMEGSV